MVGGWIALRAMADVRRVASPLGVILRDSSSSATTGAGAGSACFGQVQKKNPALFPGWVKGRVRRLSGKWQEDAACLQRTATEAPSRRRRWCAQREGWIALRAMADVVIGHYGAGAFIGHYGGGCVCDVKPAPGMSCATTGRVQSYLNAVALQTGSRAFDVPFDRQQLADYLNVERTALSKELGRMQKEDLLRVRKNHFVITENGAPPANSR